MDAVTSSVLFLCSRSTRLPFATPQPLPIPLFFVPLTLPPLSPRILSLSSAGVALVTVYLPIRNNDNQQPIDLVPP